MKTKQRTTLSSVSLEELLAKLSEDRKQVTFLKSTIEGSNDILCCLGMGNVGRAKTHKETLMDAITKNYTPNEVSVIFLQRERPKIELPDDPFAFLSED